MFCFFSWRSILKSYNWGCCFCLDIIILQLDTAESAEHRWEGKTDESFICYWLFVSDAKHRNATDHLQLCSVKVWKLNTYSNVTPKSPQLDILGNFTIKFNVSNIWSLTSTYILSLLCFLCILSYVSILRLLFWNVYVWKIWLIYFNMKSSMD